jgi:hypothetical protein
VSPQPSLTPPETPVQVVIDVGGALTSVTPFFSGHCPGSAAFLFHNDEMGRVLHTGDWRLEDLCVLLLSHETSLSLKSSLTHAVAPAGRRSLRQCVLRL